MEGIALFVSIVIIVFGVLQIILFFKLWGMTNNVAELTQIAKGMISNKQVNKQTNKLIDSDIKQEDLVVELKTERQMRIASITNDGKYECKVSGNIVGTFSRNEIELFDKYYKK